MKQSLLLWKFEQLLMKGKKKCFAKLISYDLLPTPNLFGSCNEYSNTFWKLLMGVTAAGEKPLELSGACESDTCLGRWEADGRSSKNIHRGFVA